MRLALDIDSTLYPLTEGMATVPGGSRVRIEDCRRWDSLEQLCDDDVWTVICRAIEPEIANQIGLFPNALMVLRALSRRGASFSLISARPQSLRAQTEAFLSAQAVPHQQLHLLGPEQSKAQFCQRLGLEVLVDDDPAVLAEAAELGLQPLGLRFPYNSHLRGVQLCRDWLQLGAHLNKLLSAGAIAAA